jgi:hypothetical protein
MRKKLFVAMLSLFCLAGISQNTTIVYDQKTKSFNGGMPLPAQKHFTITGEQLPEVQKVILDIFSDSYFKKHFTQVMWTPFYKEEASAFYLPVQKMLRSNEEYSFRFKFFVQTTQTERENMIANISESLNHYMKAQARVKRKRLKLNDNSENLVLEMNQIVNGVFSQFDLEPFEFSQIASDKIIQIEDVRPEATVESMTDSALLEELQQLLISEIKMALPSDFNKLVYTQEVIDIKTEKLPNVLGVNVGYAATFIENDNMAYAPYAGISLPLGNSKFAPFMSKMSFSVGIFLNNLEDENNVKFTGPVVKKPIYAGLGYRVYDFVRLNAGVVGLERIEETPNNENSKLEVRAFVGLSIDLNLWIGLGKDRPVK